MTTRVRIAAQPSTLLCSRLGQAKCKDCKPDELASDVKKVCEFSEEGTHAEVDDFMCLLSAYLP